ncbi:MULTISPECIES: hypothetical protein [Nosocomiicoccus]|uniref:ABC transporter permease n=1 Tax=Nosocomiicoccus massiliensis TaxID=1232430 RepID=A0AAF1BM91_9STAP|nr:MULTISPECIES: hypothetical protein [Nosocomiicoccus]OFL47155.1 hypothetical protein HMPREF2767_03080 [Nosocomiicoccus sp. HMSC067E10]WOS95809.1 ABC transporter permease [Nosocomiicoccus massiliensis]
MGYIQWELKDFLRNKKNLLIYVLFFSVSLYYAFFQSSDYKPIERVNESEILTRYEDQKEFLDNVEVGEGTHPMTAFAAHVFPELNQYDKGRLDALKDKDYTKYSKMTSNWYRYMDEIIYFNEFDSLRYNPKYYSYGNRFAKYDGHYGYNVSATEYQAYAKADYPLSIDIFNKQTALQTLERLLNQGLISILLVLTFLLTNDIVTKDRLYPSIVEGFPISSFKKLLYKSLVAFIGTLFLLILMVPAFILIGIKNGFGNLKLPVVVYDFEFLNLGNFYTISMGHYLVQVFSLFLIWVGIIIGLVILSSILFKNEYVNLIFISVLFIGSAYLQRGTMINEYVSYFFTTYADIGNIVIGKSNYLYYLDTPSFKFGVLILGLTLLVIILIDIILVKFTKKLT